MASPDLFTASGNLADDPVVAVGSVDSENGIIPSTPDVLTPKQMPTQMLGISSPSQPVVTLYDVQQFEQDEQQRIRQEQEQQRQHARQQQQQQEQSNISGNTSNKWSSTCKDKNNSVNKCDSK